MEQLAQCLGSSLILVQVVDASSTVVGLEGLPMDALRDIINEETRTAQSYLDRKSTAMAAKGLTVTIDLRYGPVVPQIIQAAEENNADLIALASHGRTGLARMFYGSVAAGVLHRLDRPVLLIRADIDD